MRHPIQQKTINNGDRQTGKVIGGMYFFGNTEETDLNDGMDWVNIGNGNVNSTLYSSIIPSFGVKSANFFSITGNTTQTQSLNYLKGKKPSRLNFSYGVTAIADDGGAGDNGFRLALSFRVRKQDVSNNFSVIDSSVIPVTAGPLGYKYSLTIPVDISPGDKFFIQVRNVDLTNPTFDATIVQAEMVIAE